MSPKNAFELPLHNRSTAGRMLAGLLTGYQQGDDVIVLGLPRGGVPGAAPALTRAHLPAIGHTPSLSNAIGIGAGSISVPN